MKKFIIGDTSTVEIAGTKRLSIGLFLLRLIVGLALMGHGYQKLATPFSWMGEGAPVPGILQGLAVLAEFGGGLALVLGLLTTISSAGILVTMLVAVSYHINKGDSFVMGWELAGVYATIALLFILAGPGRFSLDKWINDKCKS